MHKNLKNYNFIIFIIIILLSFITILYQLNFEDFWLDEMSSFWVSDPSISFSETLLRHKEYDWHNPMLFNLILKSFMSYTSYDPETSRIMPLIFGVVSVGLIGILSYQIRSDQSFIFSTLLASLSIYIIKYSQELRPYTLLLMLSTLNMFLYLKLINNNFNILKKILLLFLFICISLLNYSTNPFSLIILFSQITASFYNFLFFKKRDNLFYASLIPTTFLYLIFNYEYINLQLSFDKYMLSSDIKNIFDGFYFPRFFGSKIMGYMYLIILIILITLNKQKIFKKDINYFFLFVVLIYCYIIPLFYSLIKTPVLHDRYIIFILPPVFILISCLIMELSHKNKLVIISFLLTFTLVNHFLEIFYREITKPEFNKIIKSIQSSPVKNIILYDPSPTIIVTFNYLKNLKTDINKNLNIQNFKNHNLQHEYFWLVCYMPRVNFNCNLEFKNNIVIIDEKIGHLVNAKLIKFKN